MKRADPKTPSRSKARIIVVRHGRPALDKEAGPRLDWRAYRDWWARYEAGSLAPGQTCPPKLLRTIPDDAIFFCSVRPRAIETAAALASDRTVTQDAVFNEAPLPPPRLSLRLRYLPKTWNKIARLVWLFGHHDGDESISAARARAVVAARQLVAAAGDGRDVVLAAHGWFNRMLRPELAALGWRCVRDGGDSYWSFRVYMRRP